MKPGKATSLKKKTAPPSELLEQEAKRMEERLLQLKEHMKQEKERRQTETRFKDGSRWRGGLTTKPLKGYADAVLKAKPKQRPASKGTFVPTSDLFNTSGSLRTEAAENPPKESTEKPETEEIRAFLESCGLEKHVQTFMSNGIEDMEVVMELTEEHLADLNLPLGHRIKLLKRIRDLKSTENEAVPAFKPLPNKVETSIQATKDSFSLFKEAVDSFRNGGTATTLPPSPKSFPTIPAEPISKPVNTHLKAVARTATEGTDAGSVNETVGLMKEVERESCWECYRIFSGGQGFLDKRFCCVECVEAFKAKYYLSCVCGKVFTRDEGELWGSTWFCSENCPSFPRLPEKEEEEEDFFPIDPVTGDPITS